MRSLHNIYIMAVLVVIQFAGYLFLYSDLTHDIVIYVIVIICNSLLYLLISSIIINLHLQRTYLYLFAAAGILFRIILLPVAPVASDDINRYIWDGKVQANGINPYKYAPSAPELEYLSTETLPAKVNFPEMKTIYPPVAQYIFYLSYELFGEGFLGVKVFLLIAEILSIFILFPLLKTLKRAPKFLLLYALCPLPIMMFMVDGHIDGIGFPFLLLTLYLFISNKRLNSYTLYGLSIASKIITIIVLPYLLAAEKRKKIILVVTIPIAVFLASYLPYFSKQVFPFESLITFTSHWMFNGSVFNILYNITDNNQTARLISYALFTLPAIVLFFYKVELIKKVYYIFFLFFLFSPTVHPWYLTWLAVLLPVYFRWSGILFVALVSIANYVIINYQLKGIWQESALVLSIEYLPIFAALIYEFYKDFSISKFKMKLDGIGRKNLMGRR